MNLFGWLKNKKLNRERILAFDLLRGTFLLVIITTHIAWAPSLFTFIGGGGRLPASAAEGFFAISGLLVGYLYAPRVLKETKKVFRKIWKRAGLLYVLAAFFTFFYTAWASLDPNNAKFATLYSGDVGKFFFNTLTMRYSFGWADFLTRYAVFMMVAPFVVWLIAKHKAWIVALGSFLVWFFFRETEIFLPFAAWQLVFMYGIILGYYLPAIEGKFYEFSKKTQRGIFFTLCSIGVISYVLSMVIFVIAPYIFSPDNPLVQLYYQLAPYFNKDNLAPARVAVGVVWFAALYMLYRHFEQQINKATRGVLAVLGRQSLFVYCLHAFILFAIDLYFTPPMPDLVILNTIITLNVLIVIYVITYYRATVTNYGKRILSKRNTTTIP